MSYYFDDVITIKDFDFDNISLNEKSSENILTYNILCRTLIGAKILHIRFGKVDEFIRVYDGTKYLFGSRYLFIWIFIFLIWS